MSDLALSLRRQASVLVCVAVLALGATMLPAGGASASTGAISGVAFDDTDRDGVRDAGEAPFAGHRIYLFDAARTRFIAARTTDDSGSYSFTALADGTYLLEYETSTWFGLRNDWVPTTTGSLAPRRTVTTGGPPADFGWRRIVRSTSVDAPLTTFTASNGLLVRSYNDAVSAETVWSALAQSTLMGPEASTTKVYFDIGTATDAVTSVNGGAGTYSGFTASLWIAYASWVDTYDHVLFHEYGHAWAEYHAHITQQDPSLAAYLDARGLAGDPRLGSSKNWDPHEMLAEDYRLLFGSATAAAYPQMNAEIAHAAQVPGLRDFLRDRYTQAPSSPPPPADDPGPGTDEEPAPSLTVGELLVTPTPVTKSGNVRFSLSVPATTTVEIVSASGTVVRTLRDRTPTDAGSVSVKWDRKDARGRRVAAGTYRARVVAQATSSAATAETAFEVA